MRRAGTSDHCWVLNLRMSPVDELRALLEIKTWFPETQVVILSQYDDAGLRGKAVRAGGVLTS